MRGMRALLLSWVAVAAATTPGSGEGLREPLRLPPGLEQTLPIHREGSYFGDALRAVHCPDDDDNPFGTCGNLLFGGLALTDAHLTGNIRIKFYPPVRNISRFEVTHPGGLGGENGVLSAPQFFRMPVEFNLVRDPQGVVVSEGDLNLETGEVTNLEYRLLFINTAIFALGRVNPELEAPTIRFPGIYGSAWARFEQREDGLLDYTFVGTSFLSLGNNIEGDVPRFPLPFCNVRLDCASIPAAGTSLHPHIRLSTKAPEGPECGGECPEIPTNTVWELTAHGRHTSFGDAFTLNIPALGGPATGRSHLVGRLRIQFGERFGDNVPFAISSMPPAGLLAEPPENPLSFPGLSLGLLGHNEFLRFPRQTYFLEDVALADDPFDVSLGAVNLKTGRVLGPMLYRGFIAQNLLFVLLEQNDGRIAPSSFYFRGPASFERGTAGETIFRFNGDVTVDFEGFRFPSPDFVKANSWVAGEGSKLDPFLRIRAVHSPPTSTPAVMSGGDRLMSSIGQEFSYNYSIPCDPVGRPAFFEYTNFDAAKGGTFRMHSVAAVSCSNSRGSALPAGQYDTVTFSGFGRWSRDADLHLATVQIAAAEDAPYVSILIDGGLISGVNTRPEQLEDSLP